MYSSIKTAGGPLTAKALSIMRAVHGATMRQEEWPRKSVFISHSTLGILEAKEISMSQPEHCER